MINKIVIMNASTKVKLAILTQDVIVVVLVILFVYAAVTKLAIFEDFKAQIGKSPLIAQWSNSISYAVPTVELIISVLLLIPKWRLAGLFGSVILMFLFTLYIAILLIDSPYLPCSCGGILNSMGWTEHLVFNILFTMLPVVGIYLHDRKELISIPQLR